MLNERVYLSDDKSVYLESYAVVNPLDKPKDVILVIPGGGYHFVAKDREGESIALAFAARGINAFVLVYSIGEDAVYPRQLLDAAAAMKYIKSNSEKYNINPQRVFGIGFSAGGHLLGELTVHHGVAEKLMGLEKDALKLCGSVFSYPVITAMASTHQGSFINLLKKPFDDLTDEEKEFHSIERHINSETPPAFIWHTSEDTTVPIDGSLRLALAYVNANIPVELHLYPHGPHGLSLATENTAVGRAEYVVPEAQDWIDKAVYWISKI